MSEVDTRGDEGAWEHGPDAVRYGERIVRDSSPGLSVTPDQLREAVSLFTGESEARHASQESVSIPVPERIVSGRGLLVQLALGEQEARLEGLRRLRPDA